MLIAACVFAFGAMDGFWYSWVATLISGAATYYTGLGAKTEPTARSAKLLARIGRSGFLASFVMRFIPGPPFIIVNVALAAARVGFWPFIGGLALGVIPKTAVTAFAGGSIAHALQGDLGIAILLAGALLICAAAIVCVRRLAARAS